MRRLICCIAAASFLLGSAAQASPLRHTGGSGGVAPLNLVTTLSVTETSGSTQTNVPVTFGLPLAPGVITAGNQKIVIVDSDGVTQLPVQEDQRASDLSGNVRFETVTVLLNTLTSNQTRTLTIYETVGTAASGTDILASDITAAGYDYTVTETDHSGSTYTCKASTGLAAGTYSSTTTAATFGKWRHGGGIATEYIVYAPLVTGGGSPHPQLSCVFDVLAFKAGSGAVSGGNPIIAIRTDRVMQSGLTQATTAVTDDWYGLTETSGSVTPTAFPNSTPSQTLTIATNTAGTNSAVTASTSLFTPNMQGSYITDGTGVGVIDYYTSGTSAKIGIYKAFASSSLTSGAYTIYGIAHQYGARHRYRIWYQGGGVTQPQYTVNLGPAWNGTSGGPSSYIFSTKMMLNYATTASAITNSPTNLNNNGINPGAYTAFSTQSGIYQDGLAGDINMYLESTGEQSTIGVQPDWVTKELIKYSDTCAALTTGCLFGQTNFNVPIILGNADKALLYPIHYPDPTTGLTMRMNNGTDWYYHDGNTSWGSHYIYAPQNNVATTSINAWNTELAHEADYWYAAYMLTGDWLWAEGVQEEAWFSWAGTNSGFTGSQLNRVVAVYGDDQMRGAAWGMRSVGEAAAITPDASTGVLGWPKSDITTWEANSWSATNAGYYNGTPLPGTNISLVNNTAAPGGQQAKYTATISSTALNVTALASGSGALAVNQIVQGAGVVSPTTISASAGGGTGTYTIAPSQTEASSETMYSNRFANTGPRWTLTGGNGYVFSQWMAGYYTLTMFHLKEIGQLNANGLAFLSWLGEGIISGANDTTDLVPAYAVTAYWMDVANTNSPIYNLVGWGGAYGTYTVAAGDQKFASNGGGNTNNRVQVGTMTLSATSGSAITATIPTGYMGGASWYVGDWIWTGDGGRAQITGVAVNSPSGSDTITLSTAATGNYDGSAYSGVAFGTTSYVNPTYNGGNATWFLPWPAPSDPVGVEKAYFYSGDTTQTVDYWDIAKACITELNQDGYFGASSAYSTIFGLGAGPYTTAWGIKWNVAARP